MRKGVIIIGFFVLFMVSVSAADFKVGIVNSEKWQDVYSTMLYSAFEFTNFNSSG